MHSVLQFWGLSPKITLCFLNDSITVSLMRAIKMKYILRFLFQVEQKLKENSSWYWSRIVTGSILLLGFAVPARKQKPQFGLIWHIDTSYGRHCCSVTVFSQIKDWEGVMEQTRERLPLYTVPTQTMACASVDGRAREVLLEPQWPQCFCRGLRMPQRRSWLYQWRASVRSKKLESWRWTTGLKGRARQTLLKRLYSCE